VDPDACVVRILDALASEDAAELEAACADLSDWLRRDGYFPRLTAPVASAVGNLMTKCSGDFAIEPDVSAGDLTAATVAAFFTAPSEVAVRGVTPVRTEHKPENQPDGG